ncbi:MAG: hypothetical protein WAL04_16235 [Acidimicrobiales bacterium]
MPKPRWDGSVSPSRKLPKNIALRFQDGNNLVIFRRGAGGPSTAQFISVATGTCAEISMCRF